MRILAPVVLLLSGCPPDPEACAEPVPEFALTQSQDIDTRLSDGDSIVMVHGPQGGWHLEVGVWARVSSYRNTVITLQAEVDEGTIIDSRYDLRLYEKDLENCEGYREGLFGFIDTYVQNTRDEPLYPPTDLVGKTVTFTGTMENEDGTVSQQLTLITEPDPRDL